MKRAAEEPALVRIQKVLSDAGVMSRRSAEREIEAGSVTVNGKPAEIGQKVDPRRDEIRYAGKRVWMPDSQEKKVYILLNKPRGYVTTLKDELDRKCVASLVADAGCRVYPVGRLDRVSEGMLILTNDGEFTQYMTHPSHDIPKYYHVRIGCAVTEEQVEKLSEPMELDGYRIRPVTVKVLDCSDEHTTLEMELREGRNRQIRKMCELVGLPIIRLKRVAIGDVNLGSLPVGKWRYLTEEELSSWMPERKERFRRSAPRKDGDDSGKQKTYVRSRPVHVPPGHTAGGSVSSGRRNGKGK